MKKQEKKYIKKEEGKNVKPIERKLITFFITRDFLFKSKLKKCITLFNTACPRSLVHLDLVSRYIGRDKTSWT